MLLSSFLFLINLIIYDLKILIPILVISVLYNKIIGISFYKQLRRFKIIYIFLMMTFLMQLYFNQEGKILINFFDYIYITEMGVKKGIGIIIKIINIAIISMNIDFEKLLKGRFKRYSKIIKITIELVPEVFVLFKNKLDPKKTFISLYKKVYKKL
ncbi:MAG: hypothetical protein ACQERZ_05665 [Fusobacteriota bacterium]